MSASKYIDRICIAVTVLALIVTILFMNGSAVGITAMADGDDANSLFTVNDLRTDWADSKAVRIRLAGDEISVAGSGAYVYGNDVHIISAGEYVVSGELTDGSLIVDAGKDDKIWIRFDGVSIHCGDGAAFQVEQAEKVFLTLAEGSANTLSSGAEYAQEKEESGIDGTVYSRDDLTINGSGRLTVTAVYRHGIVCNDDLVIAGGTIAVTAAGDGLHANDSVRITGADITIDAGDDGITASNDADTSYVYVESGSITIPSCYEGIEAIQILIDGGTFDITSTDDGINANGSASASVIRISGGDIRILNPTGRDADGLDSNGDIYISGGSLFISVNGSGGSCALDCGSESGGVCEISGGTVIAAGGSMMAEGFSASSEQCFVMYSTPGTSADTEVSLIGEDGSVLLSGTVPCEFSSIVFSTPDLQMGETCRIRIGDTESEVTVDNSSSLSGFGRFGGGMRRGMQGGMQGGSLPGTEGSGRGVPGGEIPGGEMPGADGSGSEIPGGETPGTEGFRRELPDGEMPGDEMPGAADSGGEMPGDEMPGGEMPGGEMRGLRPGMSGTYGEEITGEAPDD